VIPGELTEAVKTVTSAFAAEKGDNEAADASTTGSTAAIAPVAPPRAFEDAATQAADTARAAAEEAMAEADRATRQALP
jgi:hypothetical protein